MFSRGERKINDRIVSATQECSQFLPKPLVNNFAASSAVTYQIQQCVHYSLHSLSDSELPQGHPDDKPCCAAGIWRPPSITVYLRIPAKQDPETRLPPSSLSDRHKAPRVHVSELFSPSLRQSRIPPLHRPHDRCVTDSGRRPLPPSTFSCHCLLLYLFPLPLPTFIPRPSVRRGARVSPDYHVRKT